MEPGLSLSLAPSFQSHSLHQANTPLVSVTPGSPWITCYYYYYCLLLIMTVMPKTSLVQLGFRPPCRPGALLPQNSGPRRPRAAAVGTATPEMRGSVWWRPLEAAVGIAARARPPSVGSSAVGQDSFRPKTPRQWPQRAGREEEIKRTFMEQGAGPSLRMFSWNTHPTSVPSSGS